MRTIKKYANRKLYDTSDKKYISLDRVSELIHAGEEITIIESKTGEDITSATISQLLARDNDVPPGILIQLLKKGRGTIDFAKKGMSQFQNALTSFGEETDKFINRLVKESDISETEGSKLKTELSGHAESIRTWIGDKVDQRVSEVMNLMNLATKEQMLNLQTEIDRLTKKLKKLEKLDLEKNPSKQAGKSPAKK
jgi:polyhydroxyalkanoate synthesis repressor PhaR